MARIPDRLFLNPRNIPEIYAPSSLYSVIGALRMGDGCLPYIRRASWDEEARVVMVDGKLIYRRYWSSHGWEWKPTIDDITTFDWTMGYVTFLNEVEQ